MALGNSGNNQAVSVGGNSFTNVTETRLSEAVQEIVARVAASGHAETHAGIQDSTLTVSQNVLQADTTQIGYSDPTTTGALIYHPFGNTATYIEVTSTNVTCISRDLGTPVDGLVTASHTWKLDNITIAAISA